MPERIRFARLMPALCLLALATLATAQPSDPHIVINQLGYLPLAKKVAILREPIVGFDAPDPYTPSATMEVRRASDNRVVWSGAPRAWNNGAVDSLSGDRVWRVDFSALASVGTFYVIDPARNLRSETFVIGRGVYKALLVQAMRMFYYQRSGFAKTTPFAHPNWVDGASHLGPEQDLDCRAVNNPVPATSRDLSGGWFDAGDYNKYVNFADDVVHNLLSAYETRASYWTDDYGIPESNNGVPDILDELKWELDWMLKMQNANGAVLHKVSVTDWSSASPPSADTAARRYAPPTASATISACGAFAHAALVYKAQPQPALQAYGAALQRAALLAWTWLASNPTSIPSRYDNNGFTSASAEDTPAFQRMNRLRAAVYLFELTRSPAYRAFFDADYRSVGIFTFPGYVSPWEQGFHEAWLRYASLHDATPSVRVDLNNIYESGLVALLNGQVRADTHAYRSFLAPTDYVWGCHRAIASQGLLFAMMNRFGLDVANARDYAETVDGYIDWFCGVNPLGLAFLSNMKSIGAERSCQETYHGWYADGTDWDNATTSRFGPAPGYVVGGPNPQYRPDPAYAGPPITPPMNQPATKSYKDWNTSWPENSWEVTECAIGYQGAFVQLLAENAVGAPHRLAIEFVDFEGGKTATIRVGGHRPGEVALLAWSFGRNRVTLSTPTWCFDLGLALFPDPNANILRLGTVPPSGVVSLRTGLAPALTGISVLVQAAERANCPAVVQSAVYAVTIK